MNSIGLWANSAIPWRLSVFSPTTPYLMALVGEGPLVSEGMPHDCRFRSATRYNRETKVIKASKHESHLLAFHLSHSL